ncbi:MAG: YdcF family protein [SAR324 cluster bacterium]|nr:YdcF family protein [SAR324 cluster bacterium]
MTPVSNKQKADVIVVATAGVHASGAPSPGSTIRAHTAAQLYLEGWAPLILVTGGVTHPYDPHVHAKGMHIILRGMGVPDNNILIENKSIDTYMNSTMSTEILKARNLKKVLLVTHDYHLLRLSLVFQQTGLEIFPYAANISPKKTPSWWQYFDWENFNRLQTYAHEYIGLLAYKMRGWI